MNNDAEYDKLEQIWEDVYNRVCDLLEQYGEEDSHLPGDYWVIDSFGGYPQVKYFASKLDLLKPSIVTLLQKILLEFPGWEIVATVHVRGKEMWPDMGLFIHAHDVVDELKREYLPPEFQMYHY